MCWDRVSSGRLVNSAENSMTKNMTIQKIQAKVQPFIGPPFTMKVPRSRRSLCGFFRGCDALGEVPARCEPAWTSGPVPDVHSPGVDPQARTRTMNAPLPPAENRHVFEFHTPFGQAASHGHVNNGHFLTSLQDPRPDVCHSDPARHA